MPKRLLPILASCTLVLVGIIVLTHGPVAKEHPDALTTRATTLGGAEDGVITGDVERSESAKPDIAAQALELASRDPTVLAARLLDWLPDLLRSGRNEEVLQYTKTAITRRAHNSANLEKLERARVMALLALGRTDEALVEAKSHLFIARLVDTEEALALFSQAYAASVRQIPDIGGTPRPAVVADEAVSKTNIVALSPDVAETSYVALVATVAKTRLDPKEYKDQTSLLELKRPSKTTLMELGNLYLLSGRSDDALNTFKRVWGLGRGDDAATREVLEGMAMALRNKDLDVGAANRAILRLRAGDASVWPEISNRALLQAAANRVALAAINTDVPDLEVKRAHAEREDTDNSVDLSASIECGGPCAIRKVTSTRFSVRLTGAIPDWFMIQVHGAAGKTIRVDVTTINDDLRNWTTLHPVYCDASSLDDEGNLAVPTIAKLSVQPALGAVADSSSQKWQYILNTWQSSVRRFSFVHTFATENTYVAMRVPYTVAHCEHFLASLEGKQHVSIATAGRSTGGRPLRIVQVWRESDVPMASRPCILVYAREHADEHDTSWAAQGAIEYLLSDDESARRLLERLVVLVVPLLDPDAAVDSKHLGIITTFENANATTESACYANWIRDWVATGHRLDLVLNLHNHQASEKPALSAAMFEGVGQRGAIASQLNAAVMQACKANRFSIDERVSLRGVAPQRLGGWVGGSYGALSMLYEVNSQASTGPLNIQSVKSLGALVITASGEFLVSDQGSALLRLIDDFRATTDPGRARTPGNALEQEAGRRHQGGAIGASALADSERVVN